MSAIDLTRGRAYNVGGGADFTLSVWNELEPILAAALGRSPRVRFEAPRPSDQRVFYCDTARALRDFGWRPRVAPGDGIGRLATWILDNQPALEPAVVLARR